MLGEIMDTHPQIRYFFEPYHIWAAIDREADMINLYYKVQPKCMMDASDWSPEAQNVFDHLIATAGLRGNRHVVEKTPINTMRIGYLNLLAPQAKYIHLVRNGLDVVRSIKRLSESEMYSALGRRALSRWWGRSSSKWKALVRDGVQAGYFADEVRHLRSYAARGAYEWLVSLMEVDRWRKSLGGRLIELRYDELTQSAEGSLRRICSHLGIGVPDDWLRQSIALVDGTRSNHGEVLTLPPALCEAFNAYQERFGFQGRAVVDESVVESVRWRDVTHDSARMPQTQITPLPPATILKSLVGSKRSKLAVPSTSP